MVVKTYVIQSQTEGRVHVDTRGRKNQPTVGWTVVGTLPAAKFVAGHDYQFFLFGMVGDVEGGPFFSPNTGIEIEVRLGTGTYITQAHKQDGNYQPFWEIRSQPTSPPSLALVGCSFMIPYHLTAASPPVDFHMVARIAEDPAANMKGFFLDRPMILALDLTEIAAAADMTWYRSFYTAGNTNLPYSPTWLTTLNVNVAEPAGADWLIFHSARVASRHPTQSSRTAVFLDDGAGAGYWSNALFFQPLGKVTPTQLYNNHFGGQMRVLAMPATFTLRQRARCEYRSGNQAIYDRGYVFAWKISPDLKPFYKRTEGAATFWENLNQAIPVEHNAIIGRQQDTYLGLSVAHAQGLAASHSPYLDINGGRIWSPSLHMPSLVGSPNYHHNSGRVMTLGDGGTTLVRAQGVRNPYQRLVTGALAGINVDLYGFALETGRLPAVEVDELAGARLVIIPDRESQIALGSLPQLLEEPSYSLNMDVGTELRELRIPRGDNLISPKFLKGRREYDINWGALSLTAGVALEAFFDTLQVTGGGCFRWECPEDEAEAAWTMNQAAYGLVREGSGLYSFSMRVVELVFAAL